MNALPPAADDRLFLARVDGRAVFSLDLMKAAAEVPGGSSEEIERQYFIIFISEPDEDVEPGSDLRGPFKGLRSMVTGFREVNTRRGDGRSVRPR